ncbi:two-component system alkaline phosphatase synthesis response regulator PhoP/two-component system response regulator VicR [Ureibacillus xyleni]|uniref:Two-component system alkaline phosphatase synthesis response regulator PhoP/two-component system response regulator VicR n=1 Tax=Ureibacillus xyleni TaxID=614648 RepID=A0A285S7Q0_9BACL|nr:response regulator transcription factor [Ureibacillus xyleni]SOC03427.1 two-component system alkaline phosphatase synthesis response regulator PhoP/two-component system response regulator VicR [Ureibacillus xyleni]
MNYIKVVIVEDDPKIVEILTVYLEKEQYRVYTALNAVDGINLISNIQPDVLLLDVNLPDQNGFELAKKYRLQSDDGILFFITGEKAKEKLIKGFEVGCDDYITKPFDPTEVVVRLKANLRRLEKNDPNIIRIGSLVVNFKDATVTKDGSFLALSIKEKMLLFYMMKNPNQVLTTELLYDTIWGYDSISDLKTVTVHISTLRKKIEENPNKPQYIKTVRGFGYKFVY